MIAERWGFSRTRLDEYALRSHELAAAAVDAGAFASQLVPVGGLESDEGIRRGGSLEKLATLTTPFKEDGVISAGNASQISDGSGALLLTTTELARAHGLTPLARIHTAGVAGAGGAGPRRPRVAGGRGGHGGAPEPAARGARGRPRARRFGRPRDDPDGAPHA